MNKNNETFRMPEPKVFTFNPSNQPIRVEVIDNEPWFVANDICTVLGHTNPSVAIQMLDEDERAKKSLGRQGKAWIVNESGLYNLIFRSNKPEAKAFRKWVTSEVLPAIRKTGTYTIPQHTRQRISRGELVNADMLSLLWTIGEFLNHGDQKAVAIEIGVSVQSINRVLNGYQRSNRILHALYKRAQANRETMAMYAQPAEMRNRLLGLSRDEVVALPHAIPTVKHAGTGNQNARKGGAQ